MTSSYTDTLPKLHCYVCGKEVTINADHGKYSRDNPPGADKHYRFFCDTCADQLCQAALDRGHLIHGWILAPAWFARAALELRRREAKET